MFVWALQSYCVAARDKVRKVLNSTWWACKVALARYSNKEKGEQIHTPTIWARLICKTGTSIVLLFCLLILLISWIKGVSIAELNWENCLPCSKSLMCIAVEHRWQAHASPISLIHKLARTACLHTMLKLAYSMHQCLFLVSCDKIIVSWDNKSMAKGSLSSQRWLVSNWEKYSGVTLLASRAFTAASWDTLSLICFSKNCL